MRFAAVAALACLAVATASAQPSTPPITDSSSHGGARPVALTYRLPAELQCGHPRASSLTLTFPGAMVVPASIPAADVTVAGKSSASVTRSGRKLTVGITPPSGIQCDVISQGTVTVVVGKAAGLGNPKKPGSYAFSGAINGQAGTAGVDVVIRFS